MTIPFKDDPAILEPVRIAIREEDEWLTATLVSDALRFQQEIARISIKSVKADEQFAVEFKDLMTRHITRWLASIDLPVSKVYEREPNDLPPHS